MNETCTAKKETEITTNGKRARQKIKMDINAYIHVR